MKKKILIISRWPVGGIRAYFRYIYNDSKQFEDYKFIILGPDQDLRNFIKNYLSLVDCEFLETKNSAKDMLLSAFKYMWNNRDISLIHSHGYTAASVGVLISNIFKIPHLMTSHDVFNDRHFMGLKGLVKRLYLNYVFKRISAINVVGYDALDNFKHYMPAVDRKKIIPILNGINTDMFYAAKAKDYRMLLNEDEATVVIGYFGRFMSQKGFRDLIKAIEIVLSEDMSKLKPIVLAFGGGGFVREDFQVIKEKMLEDNFKLLPFTDDMASAIKGVDIVVMPSLWEACPLLGMEALVAGIPIIGTECIGLKEVLIGSPAKMVPIKNPKRLAEEIAKEMNDSNKIVFENYSGTAIERFSFTNTAKKLRALYSKLLD